MATIREVAPGAGLGWLKAGWQDFLRVPALSLAHGLAMVVAMGLIIAIGYSHAALLAGAFSGFVLVAPGLLVGMYAQSRALERGEATGLPTVRATWRRAGPVTLRFGLLLALVGSAWVACSSLIVSVGADPALLAESGGVRAYLAFFAGHSSPMLFWLWLLAGGMLASLVFAASAISLPMLIDRSVSVRQATSVSISAVGSNPVAAALWALIIMALTLLAVASVVGLVVVMPVLGHASWHAYRGLVDAA